MAAPDPFLQLILETVRYHSERIARQAAGDPVYPRRWMIPQVNGWDGDLTHPENMAKPFERTALYKAAREAFTANKSIGKATSASVQAAYMSMLERSFRLRHLGPARAIMHAAGRRKGHGNKEGIHTGDILEHIQNLINGGGT